VSIAQRLQRLVEHAGGIKAAADATGVPYRTWQNYVGGQRKPQAEILAQICTRLGVNGHWLLTGEGEMRPRARPPPADRPRLGTGAPRTWDTDAIRETAIQHDTAKAGARWQALSDEARALEIDLVSRWDRLQEASSQAADYQALLRFVAWLAGWWVDVSAKDHAWLLGQLRRHIPDWDAGAPGGDCEGYTDEPPADAPTTD
jgi:transcriptional regulator with XRE-family HTH domain